MSAVDNPSAPAHQEAEAQRLAKLDREAIRNYSDKRFGGGKISRDYYRHRHDEPETATPNKKR